MYDVRCQYTQVIFLSTAKELVNEENYLKEVQTS